MSTQDPVFKKHPSLERYFKTSDGTPFYRKENANQHARGLKDKKVEEVINPEPTTVNVSTPQAKTTPNKDNKDQDSLTPMQKAKLRIEAIEGMETVEEVKAALEGETAKTVLEAGEARIAALETPATGDATGTDEEE